VTKDTCRKRTHKRGGSANILCPGQCAFERRGHLEKKGEEKPIKLEFRGNPQERDIRFLRGTAGWQQGGCWGEKRMSCMEGLQVREIKIRAGPTGREKKVTE